MARQQGSCRSGNVPGKRCKSAKLDICHASRNVTLRVTLPNCDVRMEFVTAMRMNAASTVCSEKVHLSKVSRRYSSNSTRQKVEKDARRRGCRPSAQGPCHTPILLSRGSGLQAGPLLGMHSGF